MKNPEWCINKLREVALDLREVKHVSQLEHQAKKLDGVVEGLESECEWRCVDDDYNGYESSCAQHFTFMNGGPVENNFLYCHGCGRKVKNIHESDFTPNVHGSGTGND